MTKEDIIRMAREAGFAGGGCEALFRFAALVAATEREACDWLWSYLSAPVPAASSPTEK